MARDPNDSPLERAFGLQTDPIALSQAYEVANNGYADDLAACMSEAGFVYRPEPEPPPPPSDFVYLAGVTSTEVVQTAGYGFATSLEQWLDRMGSAVRPESEAARAAGEAFQALSAAGREAFRVEKARCADLAARRNPHPDETIDEQIQREIEEVRRAGNEQAEVRQAWTDWAACMRAAGFQVGDRNAARSLVSEKYSAAMEEILRAAADGDLSSEDAEDGRFAGVADVMQTEAIVTATDVECARSTDLDERIRTALRSFEEQWLADNGDRVNLVLQEAALDD